MGYVQDFNSSMNNQKIPYDDIPISRGTPSQNKMRPVRERPSRSSGSGGRNKVLISIIAVMFIINIALSIVTFGYVKNLVIKNVNYYDYGSINVSNKELQEIYIERAIWSSVNVKATNSFSQNKQGAGVVYRIVGDVVYFVTCYHVVNDGYNSIKVQLPSQTNFSTTVSLIGWSNKYDIAVLRASLGKNDIDRLEQVAVDGSPEVAVYDSNYLSLGETVFAVGNPLSNGTSITSGIISRLNVQDIAANKKDDPRYIQIDAAINGGNSGGGLFNAYGEYIGMVKSRRYLDNQNNDAEGCSYAIPSNLVSSISDSIIYNYTNNSQGDPKYVSIGFGLRDFVIRSNAGVERISLTDSHNESKTVSKYTVRASRTSNYGTNGKRIETTDSIVKVTYTNLQGKKVTLDVLNQYFFEDFAFDVMIDKEITFELITSSGEPKTVVFKAQLFLPE